MTKTIGVPSLIYPYGKPKKSENQKKDFTAFASDVNLKKVVDEISNQRSNYAGRETIENVLLSPLSQDDIDNALFRQSVTYDLVTNNDLRENLEDAYKNLSYLMDECRNSRLSTYKEVVESFPNLEQAESEGLRLIGKYFQDVRNSDDFKDLSKLNEIKDKFSDPKFYIRFGTRFVNFQNSNVKSKLESEFGVENCVDLEEFRGTIEYCIERDITTPIKKGIINKSSSQINATSSLAEPLGFYLTVANYLAKLSDNGLTLSKPEILPMEKRTTIIKDAKHPLLSSSKGIIGNDVAYSPDNNLFIITGPNNGGKTTYVKTIGLLQFLAQKGLLIPAKSAKISALDNIYTHFVSPDDITKNEGRYRNELRRMQHIFENATPYSLILLDEPCGGTSHEEAQQQSLELLDGFHKLGAATYFTTHLHGVAQEVDRNGRFPAAENLKVTCNTKNGKVKYNFKVKRGRAGKSYGVEVAKDMGLDGKKIKSDIEKRAKEGGFVALIRK